MHPCGLVCHDLLCLGLRSLESGELSCPSQSFCQQVHGVVAKEEKGVDASFMGGGVGPKVRKECGGVDVD